ncbi:MAG TPA: hypothetical protein PKC43_13080 [Phycisphaerales bacterium]|nr:hypothetical protein [Phycisphaerales bacterium]HMP38365.1 hypothetical protein [Phycisphaerales bacterium]
MLGSRGDDHRQAWIVRRLRTLCDAFAIDVVSLAVMDNHLHLILRTLPELINAWSDREIAFRWLLVRPRLGRRRRQGLPSHAPPQEAEIREICGQPGRIATLRSRLADLSWFMKELKEPLARLANAEDGVEGRFWQDRFRSHRLLDEASLLCCATYVDLNPVKAGMTRDPLLAEHTSAAIWFRRIVALRARRSPAPTERTSAEEPNEPEPRPAHETLREGEPPAQHGREGRSAPRPSAAEEEEIEALLSACDTMVMLPSIGAHRQCHIEGGESLRSDHGCCCDVSATGTCCRDLIAAGLNVEPPRGGIEERQGSPPSGDAASMPRARPMCGREPDGGRPASDAQTSSQKHRCSTAGPNPLAPPIAILSMTLGAYLRRLRAIGSALAELVRTPARTIAPDASSEALASRAIQSVLDGEHLSAPAMASAFRQLRFRGNVIGSTPRLAEEATRRGARRLLMALRTGLPPRQDPPLAHAGT